MNQQSAILSHLFRSVIPFDLIDSATWKELMKILVNKYKSHFKDIDLFIPLGTLLNYNAEQSGGKSERKTDMKNVQLPTSITEETRCFVVWEEAGPITQVPAEPNLCIDNITSIIFTQDGNFLCAKDERESDESIPNGAPEKFKTLSYNVSFTGTKEIEKVYSGICLRVIYNIQKSLNDYVVQRKREPESKSNFGEELLFITSHISKKAVL